MKQGNQKRINYIHVLMKCKIMNLIYTLNFIAKRLPPLPQVWNVSLFLLKEICLGRVSDGVFPRLLSALY